MKIPDTDVKYVILSIVDQDLVVFLILWRL